MLARLEEEYEATGKRQKFQTLKRFLWGGDGSITYAQIAAQLDMTETGVKTAVRRLRLRYAQLLRHEVAQTVSSAEELEDELRWLRTTFA